MLALILAGVDRDSVAIDGNARIGAVSVYFPRSSPPDRLRISVLDLPRAISLTSPHGHPPSSKQPFLDSLSGEPALVSSRGSRAGRRAHGHFECDGRIAGDHQGSERKLLLRHVPGHGFRKGHSRVAGECEGCH